MDLCDLPLHYEFTFHGGSGLGTETGIVMTWSLRELHEKNKFEKTYFWGVIYGEKGNYYIAFGIHRDYITGRTFYYSINGEEWVLLPPPPFHLMDAIPTIENLFSGDPTVKFRVDDWNDSLESDSLDIEKIPSKKKVEDILQQSLEDKENKIDTEQPGETGESDDHVISEEVRLAAVVHLITEDTAVVPRGAYIKNTKGKMQQDDYFRGLGHDEALEFRSYFHFRTPRETWNKNLTNRSDSDFAIDVLDIIDDDIPEKKTWAIRKSSDNMVILRNLSWPGMIFYHKLETKIHGFVYFGQGVKNLNLPFML